LPAESGTDTVGALKNLRLVRPLVFLDLESTGTDPLRDRIVEIAVLRVAPDGTREARCRRVHPGRPIPAEATAVHGIRDEDVRDAPAFRQIAKSLLDWIGEADLAGFNVRRFDVLLLDRELADCGLDFGLARRRVVDVMTIFHRREPRDLSAAVRFYLGREHEGAHAALEDVEAAASVLDAQLARYADLPRTVEELDGLGRDPAAIDHSGKFVWREERVVFSFGRHQGRELGDVAREARDYLEWILDTDFPADAKEIVRRALAGELPGRSGQSV
jgi:DNA polymerase-3 subunit epsilon